MIENYEVTLAAKDDIDGILIPSSLVVKPARLVGLPNPF